MTVVVIAVVERKYDDGGGREADWIFPVNDNGEADVTSVRLRTCLSEFAVFAGRFRVGGPVDVVSLTIGAKHLRETLDVDAEAALVVGIIVSSGGEALIRDVL